MNFFRTLQATSASYTDLRDAIIRRRYEQPDRRDIPPQAELIAFVEKLDADDFHRLLIICGAFMAKARGYDVFSLPHPPVVDSAAKRS